MVLAGWPLSGSTLFDNGIDVAPVGHDLSGLTTFVNLGIPFAKMARRVEKPVD